MAAKEWMLPVCQQPAWINANEYGRSTRGDGLTANSHSADWRKEGEAGGGGEGRGGGGGREEKNKPEKLPPARMPSGSEEIPGMSQGTLC